MSIPRLTLISLFVSVSFACGSPAVAKELGSAKIRISGWRITVDTSIDGKKRTMLLDTGAGISTIAHDRASAKYAVIERSSIEGVTGKSIECDLIQVQKLKLGSVSRREFPVRRCKTKGALSNLLGIDFFAGSIFELDFPRKRFVLHDQLPDDLVEIPMTQSPTGHLAIEAQLQGEKIHGLFDTGWAGMNVIDSNFVAAHSNFFERIGEVTTTDPSGVKFSMPSYRLKETLRIGPYRFHGPTFAAREGLTDYLSQATGGAGEPIVTILGADVAKHLTWFIDLQNKKMAVIPPADYVKE